jgi:hypothetical protein
VELEEYPAQVFLGGLRLSGRHIGVRVWSFIAL